LFEVLGGFFLEFACGLSDFDRLLNNRFAGKD
jgi:hypothetical protein